MEKAFADLLEANSVKMNPEVMDGLACVYMKEAELYMDRVFRSCSYSFPPGLKYLGYRRCTPHEEFMETTKPKSDKRSFDLAKSDIYLVKYEFTFNDQPIPGRYISLPYVNDGGIFSLGGSKFHITPVLSDKVLSPGYNSVFVRLLRDKIIFKRCYHAVVINGRRETAHVVWSQIYRKIKDGKKVPTTTKANTCLGHYLFAKYGFTDTFSRFTGYVPIVTDEVVDRTKYPDDQWVLLESTQIKPKTFIGEFYQSSKIKVLVPVERYTPAMKNLLIEFFYVVDHFPERFKPEYLDYKNLWMILLGHIIFSGVFGENRLYGSIQEHFLSLDDYVDNIIIEKLRECNYEIGNFYDLLFLLISNFNNMMLDNDNNLNSMYNKSLEVLYYVLYDIIISVFTVNFKLSKLASKKELSMNDVVETFNRNMKTGAIFGLSSGKIISETVSYSGDHKFPKITSKVTEQESLPGAARGKRKRSSVGVDKHLDISMVESGSILYISKSNPSPTNRINPFVTLDLATGTILPNPKFTELRLSTENSLKGVSNLINTTDIGDDDGITILN